MRSNIYFLPLIIAILLVASVFGYDRELIHSEQLGDIDLSQRAYLAPFRKNITPLKINNNDLLISESAAPATFTQDNVSVIALSDGSWLAAWTDNRKGADKIFWQQLDSNGNMIGANIFIAGSNVGADYDNPRLDVDTLGRVYLFYRDRINGLIYGSRYNSDLTEDLPPFLVNDTTQESYAGLFDFGLYPDGRIVVAWENYSTSMLTIEMKLYDVNGNSIYGPVIVNTDGVTVDHWVPSVAIDPAGDFLIAWEDYRNNRADIYIQLFDSIGVPQSTENIAIVSQPDDTAPQFTPKVAFSVTDKFVIGWIDQRQGQEVFIQRYSAADSLIGNNVMISGPDPETENRNLDLTISMDDKLLAAWEAFGTENNIMHLRFDTGFTPIGSPLSANNLSVGRRWMPSAAYNLNNDYALAWTEFTVSNADINLMLYNQDGSSILSSELKLNDDAVGAVSSDPFVVPMTNWYNLIVFVDKRNDAGDIFCQTVSNAEVKISSNVKLNQDIGYNLQSEPSAAVSIPQSKSLVVWIDSRDINNVSGQRIFSRFGNQLGEFTDNEFIISDSLQTAIKGTPRAVMDASGRGLVVWTDNRDDTPQIYGRWLATDGSLDGGEILISDPATDSVNVYLSLGLDSLNRFYVIWMDKGLLAPTVKLKWFNSDGSEGGSFNWASSILDVAIDEMSAAVNDSGDVSIIWTGTKDIRKLYLTVIKNDGNVLLAPFEITDDTLANPSEPFLAISNNNYLNAVWVDRRNGNRAIYYQILNNSYDYMGNNLPVTTATPEFMISPSASALYGRAWFTWVDPRIDGMNVYASTIIYDPTDIDDDNEPVIPGSFNLSQNYPNPFNPFTEIVFSLPVKSHVSLTVYNMLGQKVASLVNETYQAGEHTVTWDGTNSSGMPVASGIYLYRMETDSYTASKKMILLK